MLFTWKWYNIVTQLHLKERKENSLYIIHSKKYFFNFFWEPDIMLNNKVR